MFPDVFTSVSCASAVWPEGGALSKLNLEQKQHGCVFCCFWHMYEPVEKAQTAGWKCKNNINHRAVDVVFLGLLCGGEIRSTVCVCHCFPLYKKRRNVGSLAGGNILST